MSARLNMYTCRECHGNIVTVDRDEGVTPFMLKCRAWPGCGGPMQSHFYRGVTERETPTYEWFKPTDLTGLDEGMREHVERGGLVLRKIEKGEQTNERKRENAEREGQ